MEEKQKVGNEKQMSAEESKIYLQEFFIKITHYIVLFY